MAGVDVEPASRPLAGGALEWARRHAEPPVYFWLKVLHISAMAVWFSGLVLLPRLLRARARGGVATGSGHWQEADPAQSAFDLRIAHLLYFKVMSPAGVVTIALGLALVPFAQPGAWLVLKLAVVAMAVMTHLYLGVGVQRLGDKDSPGPSWLHRLAGWAPLVLLLALAALTGGKPVTVPELPAPPMLDGG